MESSLIFEQKIYKIGIVKRADSDVVFSEVKMDSSILTDRMFVTSPYHVQISAASISETLLLVGKKDDSFWKDVKESVESISREANNQSHQLYFILKENPYLPMHKFVAPYLYSCYFSMLGYFLHIPVFSCCLTVIVFLLTGHVFILIFFVCFVIACLMDLLSCRLFCFRESEDEREWLWSTMQRHPHLDTWVIDENISRKLRVLSFFLMDRYPLLEVEYTKKICKHDVDRRHFYYDDQFILLVKQREQSIQHNTKLVPENRVVFPFQIV
jgi:hypothetical protein